ncbi:hypothetical protein D3C77_706170 [compost metagenome]
MGLNIVFRCQTPPLLHAVEHKLAADINGNLSRVSAFKPQISPQCPAQLQLAPGERLCCRLIAEQAAEAAVPKLLGQPLLLRVPYGIFTAFI